MAPTPMPTDPKQSLMDDAEFLAELEKLERLAPRERTAEPAFAAGLSGLDEGLHDQKVVDASPIDWSPPPPFRDEEEILPPERPSARRVALAVGGFLLLMALGAGAAAYVFRDRVALILSLAGK